MIALALLVAAAAAPNESDAHLMVEIVATAAQRDGVEVISQGDVKRAASLDAERQLAGDCSESCMSEVAAAMGARMVLDVTLGTLADDVVATVNLYDTGEAKSQRRVVRADSVPDLVPLTEQAVKETVAAATARKPPSATWKLLVLDVKLQVQDQAPPPVLGIAGGVALGAGVLAAGAGAILDLASVGASDEANAKQTPAALAVQRRGDSDALATGALVSYAAGGVLVVAGAGLLVAQLAGE